MVAFASMGFWVLVAVLAIVVRGLGLRGTPRAVAYGLALLALLSPIAAWPVLAALLGIAAYGYVALRLGGGRTVFVVHIAVLSAALALSQHLVSIVGGSVGWLGWVFPLIGLPYVYLRLLHLLVEVRSGRLPLPSPLRYVVYLLPFHQLLAGPIERYGAFEAQLEAPLPPLDRRTTVAALDRLTNGLVKKYVLAELLLRGIGFTYEGSGLPLWLEVDLFALYIYLDFSGYMDIAIGVGILIGWVPPENFNWPYLARNIIDFWKKWHITLSEWIRDYTFTPLLLNLQRGPLGSRPLMTGILSYFVSMVFCGLWHRFDLQFLLWGVLHGLGITACKLYETGLKKAIGRKRFKAYRKSRAAEVVAAFVTFQFVAVSFLFAFNPLPEALDIVWRLLP